MAVMGVAQAASSASGARKAARRQGAYQYKLGNWQNKRLQIAQDYQEELGKWQADTYRKVATSEQNSLTGQYAGMLEMLGQKRQQALELAEQFSVSSEQGQSQLRTAAAENETTGNSVMLAQQVYQRTEARSIDVTYRNLDAQFRQANRDMLAMQANSQSRVNQAMPAPMKPLDPLQPMQGVAQPSMLPYVIQGASSVIGAAAHAQSIGAFPSGGTPSGPAYPAYTGPGIGGGSAPTTFNPFATPTPVGTNSVLAPSSPVPSSYVNTNYFNPLIGK